VPRCSPSPLAPSCLYPRRVNCLSALRAQVFSDPRVVDCFTVRSETDETHREERVSHRCIVPPASTTTRYGRATG
jgi:hypothetical protein